MVEILLLLLAQKLNLTPKWIAPHNRCSVYAYDSDKDGIDELYFLALHKTGLYLAKMNQNFVYYWNTNNNYVNKMDSACICCVDDVDNDKKEEIFVVYSKNDSLFLRMYDSKGRFVYQKFILTGQDYYPPEGWHGDIRAVYSVDIDKDGLKELIVLYNTGWDRKPRGVLAFSPVKRKILWRHDIAPSLHERYIGIDDIDEDGVKEIVIGGTCNM